VKRVTAAPFPALSKKNEREGFLGGILRSSRAVAYRPQVLNMLKRECFLAKPKKEERSKELSMSFLKEP